MIHATGSQRPDPRKPDSGYWQVKMPGHPLAVRYGWVARHRMVLFDHLARTSMTDTDPCALCGYELPWRATGWTDGVNVDHINGVKGDDRPENLRVLCGWCNSNRDWAEIEAPDEWGSAIDQWRHVEPRLRPSFVELLAVEWGIGTTDLLWTIRTRHDERKIA